MWDRWITLAQICRFGNQDIYRLLGRDPSTKPLTSIEISLFHRALYEIVSKEYEPREQTYTGPDPTE